MGIDFSKYLDDEDDVPISPVNSRYENPDFEDDEGYPGNLDDEKTKEQIRQLKIKNERDLRTLVEKDLVTAILGEVGQSIQNNFVDQAKRKANTWANLLGVPGKERDIEKLISDMLEEGINGMIGDIERLVDDGVFE